ncbi:MAG: glutamate-5-semialdehyde dehydrogenase [Candidatus Omnitrophota bacterium]
MDLKHKISTIAQTAKLAAQELSAVSTEKKNQALKLMARFLIEQSSYLIRENQKDLKAARNKNYSKALIQRLTLTPKVIKEMADCLLATAKLKDPSGEILAIYKRPNGLLIKKVRTPLGVIAIIYESRPNVTSDCIGLCLKSGNAVILRGGKEAIFSNQAVVHVLHKALKKAGISLGAVNFISLTDHKAVDILLGLDQWIDLVIPRGGQQLIESVMAKSKIPVIKNYKGVCHTYVSSKADLALARKVCFNAKVQKPGVCNAMETLLVDKNIAKKFLPQMIADLQKAGVEIRGCSATKKIIKQGIKKASEHDWSEEYLDLILSVKIVSDLNEAVGHINRYGSHHSDAIITRDSREAQEFLRAVDSACLYVNASTRFTDGYQFGMGAEIGISTDKLHARGPMALEELTTYKYFVFGKGQVRT